MNFEESLDGRISSRQVRQTLWTDGEGRKGEWGEARSIGFINIDGSPGIFLEDLQSLVYPEARSPSAI